MEYTLEQLTPGTIIEIQGKKWKVRGLTKGARSNQVLLVNPRAGKRASLYTCIFNGDTLHSDVNFVEKL